METTPVTAVNPSMTGFFGGTFSVALGPRGGITMNRGSSAYGGVVSERLSRSFEAGHRVPAAARLASGISGAGASGPSNVNGAGAPQAPGGTDGNGGVKMERIMIGDLMKTSGVKFGTSGARGEVKDMTDRVCFAYTVGFLQHLMQRMDLKEGDSVAVGGDLRPSTDRIMGAVGAAGDYLGLEVINLGKIPSPATALYGIEKGVPNIMVTGSHIPADRNGIKFNTAEGEILKSDEAGIKEQVIEIPTDIFDEGGMFVEGAVRELASVDNEARDSFIRRYVGLFGPTALQGIRVGLYEHTAVGRDMLASVLGGLGAEVTRLGRSEEFIPVDTEAIREEDIELAKNWSKEYGFDAIVSTDGDSDRPLVAGRDGEWLRGDVLGILVAKFLGADSVAAPVSCNTALEKSGLFEDVTRTKIGSPYVIQGMMDAVKKGFERVVSYEANGGVLTMTDFEFEWGTLTALPTRDSFIAIIAALLSAKTQGKHVEELVAQLPPRFTASGSHKPFPTEKSKAILAKFSTDDEAHNRARAEEVFGDIFGKVASIDYTDGVRITFESGNIVHLRPSGNSPEFRVYTEADSEDIAAENKGRTLEVMLGLAA